MLHEYFISAHIILCIYAGLYPEAHAIVGNQFYDSEVHKMTDNYLAFFNIDDERTTSHMSWWQKVGG